MLHSSAVPSGRIRIWLTKPKVKLWAYSYPRVIHRSEESPKDPLPAASVNNSAAGKVLVMNFKRISLNRENTHRPATNSWARHSTPNNSPSRFFKGLRDGGFNGTAVYEMCSPLRGGGSLENLD